jgi:hypothetical protein
MSISYWNLVSLNGTEKEFMSDFIDYLTSLDSKITCSSNVNTEFSDSDLTHVPTFNFSINNKLAFTLTRAAALNTDTSSYNLACGSINVDISWQDSAAYTDSQDRGFYVSYLINDNFVLLSINSSHKNWQNRVDQINNNIIYAGSSGASAYWSAITNLDYNTRTNIYSISGRTFYEINGNNSGLFTSRFSYTCPPGEIDYVKSSTYLNSGVKKFDITSIYDCTTVTLGDTVSLKDGAYLAVGTHQLVKV